MQDHEELEQRIVKVRTSAVWLCHVVAARIPTAASPPKTNLTADNFERVPAPARIWRQSLAVLSVGRVNQYKLITWLDPLGTKTSSVNHDSTFQQLCLSNSQLWQQEWKMEGGYICSCGFFFLLMQDTASFSTYSHAKVPNIIVTWVNLLIIDH